MPREKTFDQIEVVKNALFLFWKHGFHKTSIKDLVKYLGVNRASLYDTFEDKEGLFISCFQTYKKTQMDAVKEILNKYQNPKEGLKHLFDFILNSICSDPDRKGEFISNTISDFLPKTGIIEKHLKETKEEAVTLIEDYLKKGVKNGYIKKDRNIKGLANSIIATAIGSTALSKIGSLDKEVKENLLNNLDIILCV